MCFRLGLARDYKNRYPDGISETIFTRVKRFYKQILDRGLEFDQCQPPLVHKNNRGRPKNLTYNLLSRFQNYRDNVLSFLTELNVPFTNNQAERRFRHDEMQAKNFWWRSFIRWRWGFCEYSFIFFLLFLSVIIIFFKLSLML